MTAQRDLDTILAAWLDQGPTDLPEATRRAILTALPTTTQARRGPLAPWRQSMSSFTRIAAIAAVAIVAIGGAVVIIGRPSAPIATPTPAASPSPASATVSVQRAAAGYTITIPAEWTHSDVAGGLYFSLPVPLTSATVWEGKPTAGPDPELTIDEGAASYGDLALVHGRTIEELIASTNEFYQSTTSTGPSNPRETTIDGERALIVEHLTTNPDQLSADAVVIHGGRAYAFVIMGTTSSDAAAQLRRALDAVLASIVWAP